MYVRNIDPGLRGVNTPSGTVYLAPGEGRELELVAAEEASARATGWFLFGEAGMEVPARVRRRRKAVSTG